MVRRNRRLRARCDRPSSSWAGGSADGRPPERRMSPRVGFLFPSPGLAVLAPHSQVVLTATLFFCRMYCSPMSLRTDPWISGCGSADEGPPERRMSPGLASILPVLIECLHELATLPWIFCPGDYCPSLGRVIIAGLRRGWHQRGPGGQQRSRGQRDPGSVE